MSRETVVSRITSNVSAAAENILEAVYTLNSALQIKFQWTLTDHVTN